MITLALRATRLHACLPSAPDVEETTQALTLVVQSWLLGDVNWEGELEPQAWLAYSVDLDGRRSTAETEDHCDAGGLSYQVDGPEGQDNGFAQNLHPTLYNFSESRALSAQCRRFLFARRTQPGVRGSGDWTMPERTSSRPGVCRSRERRHLHFA